MNKEWKYIPDSDNCYVSNYGEVKQIVNGEEKMLHQFVDNKGYLRVTVRKCDENGKTIPGKSVRVHRLVGEAFIPKVEGLNMINHINGNKQYNLATNLEWTDTKGNSSHAAEHGLYKVNIGKKPIVAVDMVSHKGYTFESVREASEFFNTKTDNITSCIMGRTIQSNGVVYGEWDKDKGYIPSSSKDQRKLVGSHLIKAKQSDYKVENRKKLKNIKRSQNNDGYYVTDIERED